MRNMKGLLWGVMAALGIVTVGCSTNPGDNLGASEEYQFVDSVSTAHLYGMVRDAEGNALAGVLVTSGQDSAVTGERGGYLLEKCRAVNGRCVVKFERPEYFSVIRTSEIEEGEARVDAILMEQDAKEGVTEVARFYNSQGATIEVGKMKVEIPANSLVYEKDGKPFDGSVFASLYYLNPNSENFVKEMPGGDMSGVTADGKSVILLSYGMVEVTLKDSLSQKLQLKEGAESTLTFPAPDGFSEEQKHNQIPLWYFDEEKGTWVEEGVATKSGNLYVGKVKHFSWHNLDVPSVRATIGGRVTNDDGKPLPGVWVTISQTGAYTDKNGYYWVFVPQETPVFVTVKPSDYAGNTHCPLYQVEGLPAEKVYVQDIVLPNVPCIHGKVTDQEGTGMGYVQVTAGETVTYTRWTGEYFAYVNSFEPFELRVSRFATLDKHVYDKYEFKDGSEIDGKKSYDFVIERTLCLWGMVFSSDDVYNPDGYQVTVLLDGKEYQVHSWGGKYAFNVSKKVKDVSLYVKAEDGFGVESNRVSFSNDKSSYKYLSSIVIPAGIPVCASVVNTCGPSRATMTVEVGSGKNKKIYSQTSKYGDFVLNLPQNTAGSKAKVKINCQEKRVSKRIHLEKKRNDLGTFEFCSGEKPEPDCIYAIIDDKTVKFDTKRDKITEMCQRTKDGGLKPVVRYKYQAWYKSPDYNGTLVLEITDGKDYNSGKERLSFYLFSDDISASANYYVAVNKENVYTFKSDMELCSDNGSDVDIYLYGSADLERKRMEEILKMDYIPADFYKEAGQLTLGSANSSQFCTFSVPTTSTHGVENALKKAGYKEQKTFLDDEKRVTTIYLQENAEAIVHRNGDSKSEVTILSRDGIGNDPLYSCWKADFRNSALRGKGSNVDYMWKNEADIAQLVMFGPIMGVKFSKATDDKCGCMPLPETGVANK